MIGVGDVVYYFDEDKKFQPGQVIKVGGNTATVDRGDFCGKKRVPLENLYKYGEHKPKFTRSK